MRLRFETLPIALATFLCSEPWTGVAFAAEETERKTSSCMVFLLTYGPVIALVGFMVWYIRKTGVAGYRAYMQRNREHMDRLEALNAEALETLKRIEAKLTERQ